MMKKMTRGTALILLAMTGLLSSCNDDNKSNSPNGTGVNVTGTWTLNVGGESSTMTLNQDGETLTGSVDGIPLTGSVSENNISITTGFANGPLLVANGTVDGDHMSGTYTASTPGHDDKTGEWFATKP